MRDERKTKRQLIDELVELRQRLSPESRRADEPASRDRDAAVRQRMEEALRASVERWYITFNAMSNAICLLDLQGRIQRCNKAMVELLDRPLDEILGHHCWEVVHGTSEPIGGCPVARMQESLCRENLAVPLGDRWFNVSVDPVLTDDGQIAEVVHVITDITERKRIEEALQEGEAKIRGIIEQSLDGIVLVDEQGIVIEWNRGEETISGIKQEEALGEFVWNVQSRVIPRERMTTLDVRERLKSETTEFLRTGKAPWGSQQVENEVQRPDGTRRFIQSVTFPIKTSKGFMIGNVSRDITERKQAEEALRWSKDSLARAQEIAHLGNWDWDIQNNTLTWSDEIYRIFGVDRDFELPYENIEAMVHPDDRSMNQEKVDELLSGADSIGYELRIVRSDGEVRHIYQSAQASHDDAGNVSRIFGIMLDITERKQAEEALRESERRFRGTFDRAGIGMAIVDLQGQLLETNVTLQEMLGYSEEELRQMVFTDFTHPDDVRADWELAQELFAGKRDRYQIEKRYIRKDGSVLWGCLIGSLVRNAEGEPRFAIGMIEDITERVLAEQERAQAEEALAEQAEQLRLLSSRLADAQEAERRRIARELHDQVGQNLTALGINLNILRPYLAQAPEAAQSLIDNLLALVKETTGRIRGVMVDLRPPELDDYGLLSALRWYAEQVRTRTGLDVLVEGEAIRPRLSSRQETALFRIAQEALTNVVKHAQATRAVVTLEASAETMRFTIADNGVGFDPVSLERADTAPHWGLLTMQERAQAIGAQWRVESGPGQGTRVVVEMARAKGGQ